MTRLEKFHAKGGDEPTDGEKTLGHGKKVTSSGLACSGPNLLDVVDEEIGNSDLGSDVAELSGDTPEESILLV